MKESRVEELINKLYDMIEEATRLPFGHCSLNRDKLFDLVDEIKTNIPSDLQMAKDIVNKRDAILKAAEAEAEKIKTRSEEEAKRLVAESEITAEARRRATETVDGAEKKAQELMRAAVEYADDAMKRAEESVTTLDREIKDFRNQFKQAMREKK